MTERAIVKAKEGEARACIEAPGHEYDSAVGFGARGWAEEGCAACVHWGESHCQGFACTGEPEGVDAYGGVDCAARVHWPDES